MLSSKKKLKFWSVHATFIDKNHRQKAPFQIWFWPRCTDKLFPLYHCWFCSASHAVLEMADWFPLKWWTCLSRCCFWSSADSDFINLALQSRCSKHPKAEKELRTGIPGPDRMKQSVPFIFHPTSVLRHCECDGAERSTSNWRTVTQWINAFKMLC